MPTPKLSFKRYEFKYQLSCKEVEFLIEDLLKNNMIWDSFVENKESKDYTVTSVYFDSPSFKCYYDKINGLKDRYKLRLRIYDDLLFPGNNVFLEIKRKSDMVIWKDRMILPYENYIKIFEEGRYDESSFIFAKRDQDILNEFVCKKYKFRMTPIILVRYKRKPLVGKFNDRFRITFDNAIEATVTNSLRFGNNFSMIAPDAIIMEVKFDNSLPHWFLRIIYKYQLDRRPFSKYCGAVEMCKKRHKL